MKILGIVGSPRKEGNSFYLMREALKGAQEFEPSLETEIIQLSDVQLKSCRACESCANKPFKCILEDDFDFVLDKMRRADGLLMASPRYGPFGATPSKMQALLERLINVNYLPAKQKPDFDFPLKNKPCGLLAVSVEGRQNNLPVLHSLEQYVLAFHMRVIHSLEWPWVGVTGRGNKKGAVLKDKEAMRSARKLGGLLVVSLLE